MAQKAIVGEKVGMTQVWGDDQRVVPVTVLRIEPATTRCKEVKQSRSWPFCAKEWRTKCCRRSSTC